LADLGLILAPAYVHEGAGDAYDAAHELSEPLDELHILLGSYAFAGGDNDVRVCDGVDVSGNDLFQELNGGGSRRIWIRIVDPDDLAGVGCSARLNLHNPRANGGHLRAVVRADDGGHEVAAKGRAGLVEEAFLRIYFKDGAVGGEAGLASGRDPWGYGSAKAGGAKEEDFGFAFLDQLVEEVYVVFVNLGVQERVLAEEDFIGTISD